MPADVGPEHFKADSRLGVVVFQTCADSLASIFMQEMASLVMSMSP